MTVVSLGLLGVVAFVALAEAARHGNAAARTGVLIEAAILIPLSWMHVAFASLWLGGCWENCDENLIPSARTGDWRNTQDAWQWQGQFGIALIGAVAVLAAFVAAMRAHYRAAAALIVSAGASFGVWAALFWGI